MLKIALSFLLLFASVILFTFHLQNFNAAFIIIFSIVCLICAILIKNNTYSYCNTVREKMNKIIIFSLQG
jgi:hypothetical protein